MAGGDRLAHHLGRDVAQIDQHAEAVHLGDDLEPERGQAVPLGIVGGAVGPFGGLVVGQRHVARAEAIELAQRGQAAADLAPALDPDQRGNSPGLVDADDIVGGERALERLGVSGDHAVDDVDLLDGLADRLVAGDLAVDIDRPELRSDAALLQARHVGHQRMVWPGGGAAGEADDAVAMALRELLGDVVVAVDQGSGLEDAVDPRLDRRSDRRRLGEGGRGSGEQSSEQQGGFHRRSPETILRELSRPRALA